MKITSVSVYKKDLPYVGGRYLWGAGEVIAVADTTVVVIGTDAGLEGCGECCPIGGNYLAAYAEGVRAAAPRLAKALLGEDPRQIGRIEALMDRALKGHGYAKAAFDAACWDLLGQACGQPLWMLFGGKLSQSAPTYRVAPQKPPAEMVAEIARHRASGYRQFQIKVGADWSGDIQRIHDGVAALEPGELAFADANTGWRVDEAIRVCRAVRDLDLFIEQPCLTYEECLQVRARTDLPMKLDECVTDLFMAERVVADRAAEAVCVKVSKQGGLTKAKRLRDYLAEHSLPMVVEDTWGGEIVTAAQAHLAVSTPAHLLVNSTDLHNYNVGSTGQPGPVMREGRLHAPDGPGLGVTPDYESLGAPVAVYR
ncbi:MAG: mandelate racemase/muconate lactonizing enzyme family protein [Rhodospirillales bacterium]